MLELAIARTLYDRFPDFNEGRMAKIRSHVVSRASCAVVARELELGERLLAEAGSLPATRSTRLARNRNVLAALLEAALAALYLEHGFEPIAHAIVEAFERADRVRAHHAGRPQDRAAGARSRASAARVNYIVLEAEGPPHDRTFTAAAVIDGADRRHRQRTSKKDAEQAAAARGARARRRRGRRRRRAG